MGITYDPKKNEINVEERGLSFLRKANPREVKRYEQAKSE